MIKRAGKNAKYRKIAARSSIIVQCLLLGCADIDYTQSPTYTSQIGHCFEVQKPSFIRKYFCSVSVKGDLVSKNCYRLGSFEPDPELMSRYSMPLSWADYIESREEWDDKFFDNTNAFSRIIDNRTLYAPVKEGTQLEILTVYGDNKGSTGHVLKLAAMIRTGDHAGIIVTVPSGLNGGRMGPNWLKSTFHREGQPLRKKAA